MQKAFFPIIFITKYLFCITCLFPNFPGYVQMLIHVDDLIPDMQLEQDIELKAGSFLITLKELPEGKLTVEVIDSIRRFASQLVPEPYKAKVTGENLVFEAVEKGVDILVTACPTCNTVFSMAKNNLLKTGKIIGKIQIKDISEVIQKCI